MQVEIEEVIGKARVAAQQEGADVVLCGILPTLGKSDLSMDNITPMPRYYALNDALNRIRGGSAYRLRIEGTDEIFVEHDSVMVEACNTSYQVHLQVSAEEFPSFYNVAQLVTPPVLAACVNSPLLFGKRLWSRNQNRALRTVDGHAQRHPPPAPDEHARALRREMDREFRGRALPGRHRAIPGTVDRGSIGGSLRSAWTGRRPATSGASVAQRHGVPLESPVLWDQRGQAPPCASSVGCCRRVPR